MTDDSLVKMYKSQTEPDTLREEMREIRNENSEIRNTLSVNDLIQTVSNLQINVSTRFETIQKNFNALSMRVSNNEQILSEVNETLKKMNETLKKQNETIHTLKTSVGNQSFTSPIGVSETETILLLGGRDGKNNDCLLVLENNTQCWKQLDIKLPYPIEHNGAQFLNDNLYIFGGENKEGELNRTCKLSKRLQWEKMADMNQKRKFISNSNVILNNQIWVCGGRDAYEEFKSVEMYDPETNKWKYMKPMNKCRVDGAAAVVNGKIFCSSDNSVECYDPSSDVWIFIYNMPQYLDGHGAVEIDGQFTVIGKHEVWALNTINENAEWIEKPSIPALRGCFSIAKIHDKIFACGGSMEDDALYRTVHPSVFTSVQIFDGKVWRKGPMMPTTRSQGAAVATPMSFARSLN